MRNEDVLTEIDRRLKDQRELIDAKFTHLSAIIQNGFENASAERVEIVNHQKVTNGRVNTLEEKSTTFDRHVKNTKSVKRHWVLIACTFLALMFVTSLGSHWVIQRVDAEKTVAKKLGIELKDRNYEKGNSE